jgi:Histidine kinase-, DNA gyrase B-, and HSP90-like ATPase
MSVNGVEVIPSAQRLVKSLRDVGYEFPTAVADLIDNSIEAKSNTVWIDVVWDGEASYVTIADNGEGMSPQQLREAMRFGSERDYEAENLGKFGLGLKTASLSQCLKFTVATRQNPNRADISAYCWDVAHVSATNRWEILPIKATDLHDGVRQHLKETTGTVITWERLDRILGYKKPDGESARKQIHTMCRELEDHVAMVFHRFLTGEVRGKRLAIYINENKVAPWDPFARNEANSKKLDVKSFRLEGHMGKGDIIVEPFVLPHQSRFSSPEAFNRASGPEKWNKQQGFYIYRADRMIQSGGWSGLRALDEHRKLSRIAITFSPKLDEEFKINVAKMRVSLPQSMRDAITKAIAPAVNLAEEEYRQRERKATGLPPTTPVPPAPALGAPVPSAMPAATGGSTSTSTPIPGGGASPSPATGGHAGGGWMQAKSDAAGSVARNDVEHVAVLLRKFAKPDEVTALEAVVARAMSSLPE